MYRREHSQREAVDLQNSQSIDIVLIPFDEGAVGHGAIFQGDHLA